MGACMAKSNKPIKNIKNIKSSPQNDNKKIETGVKNTFETDDKEDTNKKLGKKKTTKKKKTNIKNKNKTVKLEVEVFGGPDAEIEVQKELEAVQEIIKHKKEILKKKNLELEQLKINKSLFFKDQDSFTKSKSDQNSAVLLEERIQRIVDLNNEAHKNLDNFNQEFDGYSVGLRRGSAKSEEIRDSVRKALSKFANFDKDIQKLQNSGGITTEFSFSPLKIPKAISKVITNLDIHPKVDTPLIMLKRMLKEKNNEMDNRNNLIEKVKNGKDDENEEVKQYKEKVQKELEQIQFTDIDQIDLYHTADVVLGFEKNE